jgi:hypothetical protein
MDPKSQIKVDVDIALGYLERITVALEALAENVISIEPEMTPEEENEH